MGHDHARRPRRRPDPGRHHLRQLSAGAGSSSSTCRWRPLSASSPGALLAGQETPTASAPVDYVGLGLLILWVGSLQIMLDKGKEHDWFASPIIIGLAMIAAIGFVAFLIWELTDENPIVDLRVFRHRGFTMARGLA